MTRKRKVPGYLTERTEYIPIHARFRSSGTGLTSEESRDALRRLARADAEYILLPGEEVARKITARLQNGNVKVEGIAFEISACVAEAVSASS